MSKQVSVESLITPEAMSEASWNFRTKVRGSNDDEYAIYVESAKALGWDVKSFDEWMNS